ncbi:MAG: hypothetical protein M3Y56_06270 [Armatimonadota bacterium]|nr:hypothetical protein [Armatimonadota bacterium]
MIRKIDGRNALYNPLSRLWPALLFGFGGLFFSIGLFLLIQPRLLRRTTL